MFLSLNVTCMFSMQVSTLDKIQTNKDWDNICSIILVYSFVTTMFRSLLVDLLTYDN